MCEMNFAEDLKYKPFTCVEKFFNGSRMKSNGDS